MSDLRLYRLPITPEDYKLFNAESRIFLKNINVTTIALLMNIYMQM